MSQPLARPETTQLALPWIVRLRYAMAAGQVATALLVHYVLEIEIPLGFALICPAIVAASNWFLHRHTATALVGGMFVLDTLCLTGLLMLTGGPTNPFSLFYLVHITLSATILTKRQTWFLGGLSILSFALLFGYYRPVAQLETHHVAAGPNYHLIGMWAGFAIATLLVAMFAGKISELLREREQSLLDMQEELAKKDRLASLVTLAAGAAHELGTPLGTIAVVAKELEHYAISSVRDRAIIDDCRLIRTEVDRCREILQGMSIKGAEPAGEALEAVPIDAFLGSVRAYFSTTAQLTIHAPPVNSTAVVVAPRHAVEQALIALVKNAVDASPADAPVHLSASCSNGSVLFEVRDTGSGMSLEALRHAGEPFFTTKPPGKGMGLGVFLVRTLAARLGGNLILESSPGGTLAVLQLPLASHTERVIA